MRSDSYGVTPFIATRPLSSAALIAAKLKVTIWSTLAAWLLVLVAIPLGLTLSGTLAGGDRTGQRGNRSLRDAPRDRGRAAGTPGTSAASTWKQLVQSLSIGLTGREWLIKSSVLLVLSFLVLIGPIGRWLHRRRRGAEPRCWNALPWILAALVCLKMSAAAWIARALYDRRLLSDRALVTGAAAWLAAVLALYGVLAWFSPTPHVARYFLRARGDPGSPPGATVRGAAGARVESASVTTPTRQERRSGARTLGTVLALLALPVALAADRGGVLLRPEPDQRQPRLLGREAGVPALRPRELRPRQADAARHQHARRGDVAGRSDGD